MKSIFKILMATILLLSTLSYAQIKNTATETLKIYGNCEMCKKSIGEIKSVANVNWDNDKKMAILIYDAKKTSRDEILKRIALAEYDNERFISCFGVVKRLKR